ncbi:MAG: chemotaxis protein CheA [Firmicutes bacterium]|nr:chemotaxis protein CheA [Bacillota bacterium]
MFSNEEIAVFMEELDEKIQVISDNLLTMEKGEDSPEVLQEIFRAAHTIKGSSAVMGYDRMSTLTHQIENLFEQLRQHSLPVTAPLIDTLFEALDTLHALRDEITGEGEEVDTSAVTAKIAAFKEDTELGGTGEDPGQQKTGLKTKAAADNTAAADIALPQLEETDETLITQAQLKGFNAYWVTIVLDQHTQMKEVRAFIVFETLQEKGEIIKSDPPAEDVQEGNFEHHFTVILLTEEDTDHITNLATSVADVKDVRVQEVLLSRDAAVAEEVTPSATLPAREDQQQNPTQGQKKISTSKTVRVDVQKLDTLMNLVGELVIDRTRLNRFTDVFESQYGSDDLAESLMEISSHLGQVTTDLQDEIMKARMLPVSYVFNRFPRMVRDIAQKMDKEVEFTIEGKETELDRNVIEIIGDPLIHLLRNSIDHGIEPPEVRVKTGKPRKGKVQLKASYVESHIVITLEDDGKGMDPEKLRSKIVEKGLVSAEQAQRLHKREILDYIFAPGFSTTENVNDISGRGVGMDIVRSQIEQINGSVEFNSIPGQGTTFTIKLPLTLAIINALMVTLGKHTYAFPLTHIVETLAIEQDEIKLVRHSEVVIVRGSVLPLVRLSSVFNQQPDDEENSRLYVVVLGSGDRKVGVVVDRLLGEQEIVIKSLGSYMGHVDNLSGATILGDGKVALIVDPRGIIKESGTNAEDVGYAEAN